MTSRQSIVVMLGMVLVVALGVFAYTTYLPPAEELPNGEAVNSAPPVFVWGFEDDDSLNLDGMPRTNIYLDAVYAETKDRTLIDTVDGGCSVLEETETGSASATAQCYWAGLGFRYKVVQGSASYQVQRQTFEESSPDYTAPEFEYETILESPW